MPTADEVTAWISQLSGGDEQAAQVIWNRYFGKLIRLADKRLRGISRRTADEEDVALSAMKSFFRGAQAGRFPRLTDRDDLWKVLVTITARKATAQRRLHLAQKRGAGKVRGESVFDNRAGDPSPGGIWEVFGQEPTADLAAQFAEEMERLLGLLEDESLREVALLKLEAYTNAEIAERLGRHRRSVERKLRVIREIWESCRSGEDDDDV
jgi:DNA-directed RNA polymerase specialized sigma24 family protein